MRVVREPLRILAIQAQYPKAERGLKCAHRYGPWVLSPEDKKGTWVYCDRPVGHSGPCVQARSGAKVAYIGDPYEHS